MKWVIDSNVNMNRGNHQRLMVKFNNSNTWFEPDYCCTTQTFKKFARELGNRYNSKVATIKLFNMDDYPVEVFIYNGECEFRKQLNVGDGNVRTFVYFNESEMFDIL